MADPKAEKGEEKAVKGVAKARKEKGMLQSQLKAFLLTAVEQSQLWRTVLIVIGFLSLALVFQFYNALTWVLAIIVAVIAWNTPALGVVASVVLILPAVAFQSPIFGWLYLLVVAFTLFEVWKDWYLISAILAVVSAPFTPYPLNIILGASVIPILTFSSLRIGSRKTAIMVPIVVFAILLLSVIWDTQNASFLPVNPLILDSSAASLLKPSPLSENFPLVPGPGEIGEAISNLGNFEYASRLGEALGFVWSGIMNLFLGDVGLIQIILWSIVFYAVAYLPRKFEGKWEQFYSSAAVLAIIPIHFLMSMLIGVDPILEVVPVALLTVAVIWMI